MYKPIEAGAKLPKLKNGKIQFHVNIARDQYLQFQAARKKLGYGTNSEAIRECVRRIIAEAREHEKASVSKDPR